MGHAIYKLDFGIFDFEYEENEIIGIKYLNDTCCEKGVRTSLTDIAAAQLSEYFEGKRKTFDFPYRLIGTPFQKKVWSALCSIPYGETRTYKDIACMIGNPKACRAVGMANNKNPLIIVVPCHRVIGADKSLTGYACGLEMKQTLLELEKFHKHDQHRGRTCDIV